MLQMTTSPITNKLIFADSINGVDNYKKIFETNSKKTGTEFFIPWAKLALAKLRQNFSYAMTKMLS